MAGYVACLQCFIILLVSSVDFFQNYIKKIRDTFRVSNSLDPDMDRHSAYNP